MLLRQSHTLKDKRQVVRGILDRLRLQFGVSAAEVETLDDVKRITIAFAAISRDVEAVKATLDAVAGALRVHPMAEFLDGKPFVESFERTDR